MIDIAVPADKHNSAKEKKNQEILRPSNQAGEAMEIENQMDTFGYAKSEVICNAPGEKLVKIFL